MNIRELWEQLLQRDEHTQLEVKLGNEIGNSVMQTVCAYANTIGLDGGHLLLGIKEDNTPSWALPIQINFRVI
ncbi:MAG: putative DNA binding domain-containing protein [Methanomicrobiaceae archaeon]|uniref:RNA-binding domain-containing protein n=1 Tax=Methanoculleus sp. TaxID=90427 RepID=UPI0032117CF0|nr:putative DNA binding domain-containing protein [Methanomicrobiaceae archaeon]